MKEYELLLIIISLAAGGVYFKITIVEIDVFKLFKGKNIELLFNSKRKYTLISKIHRNVKYYHNYQLPNSFDN